MSDIRDMVKHVACAYLQNLSSTLEELGFSDATAGKIESECLLDFDDVAKIATIDIRPTSITIYVTLQTEFDDHVKDSLEY
ncbi:hypothetical protein HGRIS_001069 [Hohenbuehelia grisea]|uniref:Uncharacterized protein n=1 Tax=Hohenbuehelia grisea TaxID=104357 RepID=A0ABR3JP62_9AGAR